MLDYRLVIAPMVGHTNCYYRYTMRQVTKKTLLFTEMKTSNSILRGEAKKILRFSQQENPVIFQLAGKDTTDLVLCSKMIEDYGYSGINLNIGCPSFKVQKGGFGVCLLREPDLVAEMVDKISQAVRIPVSIKTRIGIEEQDSLEFLKNFVEKTSSAGCGVFFIHARKALLKYNPRNNRTVPPLNFERALQIKKLFPKLKIIINGEITNFEQAKELLKKFDGVMIGRKAIQNPLLFQTADSTFFATPNNNYSLLEILTLFFTKADFELQKKHHLMQACRHLFNFFHSLPNAKYWRRYLSEQIQTYPFDNLQIQKNLEKNWKF